MDVTSIVKKGQTQSGLDPELEAKAEKYAASAWNMDFKHVLKEVLGEEYTAEVAAEFQEALFQHKYSMVENADDRRVETKKAGLRYAM